MLPDASPVTVINETMAKTYFKGEIPSVSASWFGSSCSGSVIAVPNSLAGRGSGCRMRKAGR